MVVRSKTLRNPNGQLQAEIIDWHSVLQKGGRWCALVSAGSVPARVARHAVGLGFVAAPYCSMVQVRQVWQVGRSARLSLLAAREMLRLRQVGVSAVCPALMQAEMCNASPLVGNAPDPLDRDAWQAWAQPMLTAASYVVIPDIPGWECCPTIWGQAIWSLERNIPLHVYAESV